MTVETDMFWFVIVPIAFALAWTGVGSVGTLVWALLDGSFSVQQLATLAVIWLAVGAVMMIAGSKITVFIPIIGWGVGPVMIAAGFTSALVGGVTILILSIVLFIVYIVLLALTSAFKGAAVGTGVAAVTVLGVAIAVRKAKTSDRKCVSILGKTYCIGKREKKR